MTSWLLSNHHLKIETKPITICNDVCALIEPSTKNRNMTVCPNLLRF